MQRAARAQQTRKVKGALAPLVTAVDGRAELAALHAGLLRMRKK